MIQIIIPKKTLTINHLYGFRGYRKFLSAEGKEQREFIKRIVNLTKPNCFNFESTKLIVDVDIYENWLTKKGLVARKDIANREKFLIDSVFQALEIDDKYIFCHSMRKIQSSTEKAVIKIKEMK